MEYTIDCVATLKGWRYRITLWCKDRVAYVGKNTYKHYEGAKRAVRSTGATQRKENTDAV
jgi:hypothetical protein